MGVITAIDHATKNVIYTVFWWFLDPLEYERLYSQLVDNIERNLDANDPERLVAPDNFDVSVNNTIFIKHVHSIKKLETSVADRLQKYVANKDYELLQPKIKIQIISSSTVSRRRAQIRSWFSLDKEESEISTAQKKYKLKVISGEGQGMSWKLNPGNQYRIGRLSTLEICLPFQNISKKQATLHFQSEDNIKIVDDGSTNGTFINDEREPVTGSRELRLTDKIRFCNVNPIILSLSVEQF